MLFNQSLARRRAANMHTASLLLACLALVAGEPQTIGLRPTLFEQPRPQRPSLSEQPRPERPILVEEPLVEAPRPFIEESPRPVIVERQPVRASNRGEFQCPEFYGLFADPVQCDKYYECNDGVPTEMLCDDGLVFDELKGDAGHVDPCNTPFVADCGERSELQPATYPSEFCPRRHGTFADPNVCEKYYTCKDGHATDVYCSPGLHYDDKLGSCDWPNRVGRTGCRKEKKCLTPEMCCDGSELFDAQGLKVPHPAFPDPADCQKFYVCHQGTDPQLASCSLGQVFNDISMICDYPENVPDCYGWYRDHPEFADYYVDELPASDVGAEDTVVA